MIPDLVQLSWELAQDPWFLKTQKKKTTVEDLHAQMYT